MKETLIRTLTGTVFIAVILSAIFVHPYALCIVLGLVVLLTSHEFFSLFGQGPVQAIYPQHAFGVAGSVLIYFLFVLVVVDVLSPVLLWLILPLCFVPFLFELYRRKAQPIVNIAVTLTGMLYTGLPLALLFMAAHIGNSYQSLMVAAIFGLIWINDTLAYLVGKTVGRQPLFARISPKKTWEGSVGGAVGALAASVGAAAFIPLLTLTDWLVVAAIIVTAGTWGDLVESLLKRSTGVKDTGNWLPGHGGVLDRFDTLLFAMPFIWGYLVCTGKLTGFN